MRETSGSQKVEKMAAISGLHVTQIICKADKKPFVTTVP
jgi:hypothetical protein